MVVVISGTNGIVAPGLTSEDSTGTTTLTTQTLVLGGTTVTATGAELNFVDGVTSNLQTQLDAKMTPSFTGDVDVTGGLSADSATLAGLSYPTSDGDENKVITTDGAGNLTFGSFGSLTPQVVSADTTGVAGYAYYLDSDGITLTLPASPAVGDIVGVSEIAGGTTSVIGRNSSKIMSLDSDMTIDTAYAKATLIYTGASVGWALT